MLPDYLKTNLDIPFASSVISTSTLMHSRRSIPPHRAAVFIDSAPKSSPVLIPLPKSGIRAVASPSFACCLFAVAEAWPEVMVAHSLHVRSPAFFLLRWVTENSHRSSQRWHSRQQSRKLGGADAAGTGSSSFSWAIGSTGRDRRSPLRALASARICVAVLVAVWTDSALSSSALSEAVSDSRGTSEQSEGVSDRRSGKV